MNSLLDVQTSLQPSFNATPMKVSMQSTEPEAGKVAVPLVPEGNDGFHCEKTSKVSNSNLKKKTSKSVKKKANKKKWKKPKGKPNRPLSAYNLFFKQQRTLMLGADKPSPTMELLKKRVHCKTHGKIGFAEMAREIGRKWKALDPETKAKFTAMGKKEKERYDIELAKWKQGQRENDLGGALDVMATAAAAASEPAIKDPETCKDKTVKIRPTLVKSEQTRRPITPTSPPIVVKPIPAHRVIQAPPLPMDPAYSCTPGSYYDRLAFQRLPLWSRERLLLEQMYLSQAANSAIESDQHFSVHDQLAFLSQARLRQQQALASFYRS
eukprot:scaffold2649_cov137-Cylindrotheca_fusiformis.AAC.8